MKYYSDILNLLFEKEEDLKLAEKQHQEAEQRKIEAKKKKEQEKKTRRLEVERALEAAKTANENAQKLLDKYIEDYGSLTSLFETKDNNCNSTVDNKTFKITDSDISEFVNILTSFLK